MDELGNFRALPSDWEMKSSVQTAGGILTFAFSDQTEQKLYLEPQVNRIMEDDMETLAAVALAYAPDKTLQELWNATNIHGALLRKGWDEEEIARRYAAIMEEFEELQARKI